MLPQELAEVEGQVPEPSDTEAGDDPKKLPSRLASSSLREPVPAGNLEAGPALASKDVQPDAVQVKDEHQTSDESFGQQPGVPEQGGLGWGQPGAVEIEV